MFECCTHLSISNYIIEPTKPPKRIKRSSPSKKSSEHVNGAERLVWCMIYYWWSLITIEQCQCTVINYNILHWNFVQGGRSRIPEMIQVWQVYYNSTQKGAHASSGETSQRVGNSRIRGLFEVGNLGRKMTIYKIC